MEKKEIGLMRQIGYLSFVVVLLYGLTLFAVSCDNDEDPPLPPAVEKVVLAFGVDQGEGQLSAKPELENTAAEKIGELISLLSLFCCMGLRYLRFLVTMMKILLFLPQWKK